MKTIAGKYSLVVVLFIYLTSFMTPDKQIDRVVRKIWKGQEYMLESVDLNDSLSVDIPSMQRVLINHIEVGYACFSTAFGCRIGGCSSAGTPNAQSYETFDYVVVYDTNLRILKVEVVNFGGEYGYEICRPKWLKQFEGQTDSFKLNENIDGITGATVSATYLIDDLNNVGKVLRRLKLERVI